MNTTDSAPKTKMRILQVGKYYYPYYYGGMENHLFNLCEDLGKQARVDVLVSNVERKSLMLSLNGLRVNKAGKWGELAATPISPSMLGAMSGKTYDIIHLHLPNPMSTLAYFLKRPAGKLVITWHSDIVKQRFLERFYRPLQNWLLKRCDRIIVTSQNYLETSLPLQSYRAKCQVVPLGVDVDLFQLTDKVKKDVAGIRAKYRNIVYFVGRLVYYKGVNYLLKAMEQVEGCLIIASNGPLMHRLKKQVQEAKLEHKVFFLGELGFEKLLTFYHACDVFCLPAIDRSEAFGIVQLEAMVCGKPVVSTNLGTGVNWVNQDQETGIVVAPHDPQALAEAINRLLGDPVLREKFGAAARLRVAAEFTKEKVSEKTMQLYKQLL